eukprot:TRINITY_DN205_c0_g1_i2.p1 TRINITY_DN205_c0_g1~~TRINITY_DN205_c0_g1_i2.p1  ORF type:complete len:126 (+),score=18.29 TRINITY_DN205_c0_g1_i2:127-504(+)
MFAKVPGIKRTRVGYTGGTHPNPTYRRMGDHTESIELRYDPEVISYGDLLEMFWENHDPYSKRSTQYRSAIFYTSPEQKELARKTALSRAQGGRSIATAIESAGTWTDAEDYHQQYLFKREKQVR